APGAAGWVGEVRPATAGCRQAPQEMLGLRAAGETCDLDPAGRDWCLYHRISEHPPVNDDRELVARAWLASELPGQRREHPRIGWRQARVELVPSRHGPPNLCRIGAGDGHPGTSQMDTCGRIDFWHPVRTGRARFVVDRSHLFELDRCAEGHVSCC